MTLTIRELTEIEYLRTRLWAGAEGADRHVTWAHASELGDPAPWLNEGDLLMTTGLGLPQSPSEQEAYLERLHRGGLSGLVIAEHQHESGQSMSGPRLTRRFRAAANRLTFPILMIAYEVPFVALAHAVSQANQQRERARLSRVLRLYERLRAATADQVSPATLVARIGEDLRCATYVVDLRSWQPALPDCPAIPQRIAKPAMLELEACGSMPATGLRFSVAGRNAIMLDVPSTVSVALILVPRRDQPAPDLLVHQHVAAIVALEVEKARADRDRTRRLGTDLFERVLAGTVDPDSALRLLADHGLKEGPFLIAACRADDSSSGEALAGRFASIPSVVVDDGDDLLVMLTLDEDRWLLAVDGLGTDVTLGFSAPFFRLSGVADSCQEARWALRAALGSRRRHARYDESVDLPPFFPRTLGEARRVADEVLGPLEVYDRAHETQLVESLRVFLQQNRSLQTTAKLLGIHKQTVIYRMRRVEEITGRSISRTEDIASLWLALEADALARR